MKRRGFLQALAALPLLRLAPKPRPTGKWYFEASAPVHLAVDPAIGRDGTTISVAVDTSTGRMWFRDEAGLWTRPAQPLAKLSIRKAIYARGQRYRPDGFEAWGESGGRG